MYYIELLLGRRSGSVETSRSVFDEQMVNQIHLINVLDHDSEAEEAVVNGLEEVLVAQQLGGGHIGKAGEHLLGLGMEFKVSEEDLGREIGIATSQTPGVANERLLSGGESLLDAFHIIVERSVGSHDSVDVIESLFPGGFSLGGQSAFLFSGFQEQASSFLLTVFNYIKINLTELS